MVFSVAQYWIQGLLDGFEILDFNLRSEMMDLCW